MAIEKIAEFFAGLADGLDNVSHLGDGPKQARARYERARKRQQIVDELYDKAEVERKKRYDDWLKEHNHGQGSDYDIITHPNHQGSIRKEIPTALTVPVTSTSLERQNITVEPQLSAETTQYLDGIVPKINRSPTERKPARKQGPLDDNPHDKPRIERLQEIFEEKVRDRISDRDNERLAAAIRAEMAENIQKLYFHTIMDATGHLPDETVVHYLQEGSRPPKHIVIERPISSNGKTQFQDTYYELNGKSYKARSSDDISDNDRLYAERAMTHDLKGNDVETLLNDRVLRLTHIGAFALLKRNNQAR